MENYVTFDLAIKLRKKGFDEKCFAHYESIYDGNPKLMENYYTPSDGRKKSYNAKNSLFVDAPTIPQVIDWLRKKKNVYCLIHFNQNNSKWLYYITKPNLTSSLPLYVSNTIFDSYESANINGIKYVVDRILK